MKRSVRVGVVTGLLVLTVLGFLNSGFVSIRTLEIDNWAKSCVTDEQLRDTLSEVVGKYPWQLDEQKMLDRLTVNFPCIRKITITYFFPRKAKVLVERRAPLFRVVNYLPLPQILFEQEATLSSTSALLDWSYPVSSGAGWLVDDQGVVYEQNRDFTPTLFFPSDGFTLGLKLPIDFIDRLEAVLRKLPVLGLNSYQMKVVSNYIQIGSTPKLVVSLERDITYQLASLQLILAKSKIELGEIESIDLRFDKPVVVYTPRKK